MNTHARTRARTHTDRQRQTHTHTHTRQTRTLSPSEFRSDESEFSVYLSRIRAGGNSSTRLLVEASRLLSSALYIQLYPGTALHHALHLSSVHGLSCTASAPWALADGARSSAVHTKPSTRPAQDRSQMTPKSTYLVSLSCVHK